MSVDSPGTAKDHSHRTALQLLLGASVTVAVTFIAARASSNMLAAHLFDYLHWTVAAAAGTALAWLGVRSAADHDRAARRWFAYGLTFTLLGQLLFDVQEITQRTPIPNLSDALFLGVAPCCVLGLASTLRTHSR